MQRYSYDMTIRDNRGKVLDEYREKPSPVIRIPGVRDVVWDETIGRHVKF